VPAAPVARGANAGAEVSQRLAILENGIGHLGRLADRFDKSEFPVLRDAAAKHIANILRASGIAEDEIRASSEAMKKSNSLDELKAAIGRDVELVHSRLAPSSPPSDPIVPAPLLHRLSRTSQTTLKKIRDAINPQSLQQPDNRAAEPPFLLQKRGD
jgi:hypothetical protein